MPDRNRTCNPQLRRLVLYPVELRALLKPGIPKSIGRNWSGWRDLNSRHPGPKPGALPGYATPRKGRHYTFPLIKGQFFYLFYPVYSNIRMGCKQKALQRKSLLTTWIQRSSSGIISGLKNFTVLCSLPIFDLILGYLNLHAYKIFIYKINFVQIT